METDMGDEFEEAFRKEADDQCQTWESEAQFRIAFKCGWNAGIDSALKSIVTVIRRYDRDNILTPVEARPGVQSVVDKIMFKIEVLK
jgi:hypothetical protein